MTRLWLFSDIHQERLDGTNAWDPAPHAPDHDLVVVAGDVSNPVEASMAWLSSRFGRGRVVAVLGNHEYWRDQRVADDRSTHPEIVERAREAAAREGVHLLLDDTVVVEGVRFVGGTLWTDLRLGTRSRGEAHSTARRSFNDYRMIRRRPSGRHRWIRTEETEALHRATTSYLREATAVPFDGPTVVVTHHAPSGRSLPPGWDLAHLYASALDDLVEASGADLWVHGHAHAHADHRVGATRVVANPRGHRGEDTGFDPAMTVEVGTERGRGSSPRPPVEGDHA